MKTWQKINFDNRKYPAELAGRLYPDGIPIYSQDKLAELIQELDVDECVFAYSDVKYGSPNHEEVIEELSMKSWSKSTN